MREELLRRIFEYVETCDVERAVRSSFRLSRMINDHLSTAIFLRELVDDRAEISRVLYEDTKQLKEEAHKYLSRVSFERWQKVRTLPFAIIGDETGDEKKSVLVIPVGEFADEIRQCESMIRDMVVPPTMGPFDSAAFTDRYDHQKASLRLRIKAIQTVKDRLLNLCLNFAIGVERQLEAQSASMSFLQSAQNDVQNYFKARALDVHEKLLRASELVDSESPEDPSLLLTVIRRAIKAAADHFLPAEAEPRRCSDGEVRILGDEQYLNRLHEFVYTELPRSSSTELLRAELNYFLAFARRLNDVSSKGVHSVVTSAEAKQGLLGLYLLLFNVCQHIDRKGA